MNFQNYVNNIRKQTKRRTNNILSWNSHNLMLQHQIDFTLIELNFLFENEFLFIAVISRKSTYDRLFDYGKLPPKLLIEQFWVEQQRQSSESKKKPFRFNFLNFAYSLLILSIMPYVIFMKSFVLYMAKNTILVEIISPGNTTRSLIGNQKVLFWPNKK